MSIERNEFRVTVTSVPDGTIAHMYPVNVLEVARRILEDCAHSSRSVDAVRHPDWYKIKNVGDMALFGLFMAFRENPGAHAMAMLHGIAGKVFDVPEEELGRVSLLAERWIQWGQKMGYTV